MQFYQVKRQLRHKKRRKSKGSKSLTCVPLPHYHSATSADQANWWKFKYCIVGRHNKFWVLLDNFIQSSSPIWRLSTHIITLVSQSPLAVSNGKSTTQRLSVFVGHALGVGTPACVGSLTNCSVPAGYHPVTSWTHCGRELFTIYTVIYLQLKFLQFYLQFDVQ